MNEMEGSENSNKKKKLELCRMEEQRKGIGGGEEEEGKNDRGEKS